MCRNSGSPTASAISAHCRETLRVPLRASMIRARLSVSASSRDASGLSFSLQSDGLYVIYRRNCRQRGKFQCSNAPPARRPSNLRKSPPAPTVRLQRTTRTAHRAELAQNTRSESSRPKCQPGAVSLALRQRGTPVDVLADPANTEPRIQRRSLAYV